MKKLSKLSDFQKLNSEDFGTIKGGQGGYGVTDNYESNCTGPYPGPGPDNGGEDCVTTRDGQIWSVQPTGTVTCD